MRIQSKNQGSVLILVLLVVAVLMSFGTSSTSKVHSDINETVRLDNNSQAFWYALGMESKASNLLKYNNQANRDSNFLVHYGNLPIIKSDIEEGTIEGSIRDLSTCFNVNSLVKVDKKTSNLVINQPSVDLYRNLLNALMIDEFLHDGLIYSMLDWIDSNDFMANSFGAEDDFYTRLDSPYRTPNQLIHHEAELFNIKNYEPEVLNKILPFICAKPVVAISNININTISKEEPEILMMMFGEQMSREAALNILQDRPLTGFYNKDDFFSHPQLKDLLISDLIKEQIKTETNYFLLTSKSIINGQQFILQSSLNVLSNGKVKVIKRKLVL